MVGSGWRTLQADPRLTTKPVGMVMVVVVVMIMMVMVMVVTMVMMMMVVMVMMMVMMIVMVVVVMVTVWMKSQEKSGGCVHMQRLDVHSQTIHHLLLATIIKHDDQ